MAPASKGVLHRTPLIARRRGDRRIGPEHLLLALLDARAGHASRLLTAAGADPSAVAARLAR
jgi:ATP-dependent Clp protease ATP-binding subunit ClpA